MSWSPQLPVVLLHGPGFLPLGTMGGVPTNCFCTDDLFFSDYSVISTKVLDKQRVRSSQKVSRREWLKWVALLVYMVAILFLQTVFIAFSFFFLFLFKWLHLLHVEVTGPGIESEPQLCCWIF